MNRLLAYLLQGLILGSTAAAQPGPFQAYLMARTLSQGWRRAVVAALAPLISDGPIILLVVMILAQTPAWFLILVQIAGGFFLLYLAWRAYQDWQAISEAPSIQPIAELGERRWFEAALINMLGPGPYIFWATVGGPILVNGWRRSPLLAIGFIGGFYVTLVGGFAGFVTLLAVSKRLDPRLSRGLSAVSVLLLFLFGLYQLWLATNAIIAGSGSGWAELIGWLGKA